MTAYFSSVTQSLWVAGMIKFIEKKPKRENKAKILNPGFVVKKRALNQLDLQRAEWKGSAEERVRKRDESSRATYTEEGGRACRAEWKESAGRQANRPKI